jgi:hypothetical protein
VDDLIRRGAIIPETRALYARGRVVLSMWKDRGPRLTDLRQLTTADVPTRARRLGFVPQGYALFPHLTVARNIGYGLRGPPKAARADRIAEVLATPCETRAPGPTLPSPHRRRRHQRFRGVRIERAACPPDGIVAQAAIRVMPEVHETSRSRASA